MPFQLYLKPKIRKKLQDIQEKDRKRIIDTLDSLVADPFAGKQLHGERAGQYSVRAWPYRIVYRIDKNRLLVIIIEFGHRQGVY